MTNIPSDPKAPDFDPEATEYKYKNAQFLAKAACRAYRFPVEIGKSRSTPDVKLRGLWAIWKFGSEDKRRFFDARTVEDPRDDASDTITAPLKTSAQAFIDFDDKTSTAIVAFRGTEAEAADWAVDFDVPMRDGPGGQVHKGFWLSLYVIWPKILACLEELRVSNLWITGHSLGGALAVLAAARLAVGDDARGEGIPHPLGAKIKGVYTFGQPRVGDWLFASNYESALGNRTFRFVNNNDVVARVPPPNLGYRHVGRMLLFDGTGALTEKDDPANLVGELHVEATEIFEDNLRSRSEKQSGAGIGRRNERDGFRPVSDHSMEKYVTKLENNRQFVLSPMESISWQKVWFDEFQGLGLHPEKPDRPSGNPSDKPRNAPQPVAIGLALSGGGIRSATFNLGLLQFLASRGLLSKFDYLSTVSGGGYIGGWLTAWIHRVRLEQQGSNGAVNPVRIVESRLGGAGRQKDLPFNDAGEPRTVTWLRRFSNYLTPRSGPFSPDTLAGISTWLRNTLLNQLTLASGLITTLGGIWLLARLLAIPGIAEDAPDKFVRLSLSALPVAIWAILFCLLPLRWAYQETKEANRSGTGQSTRSRNASLGFTSAWVLLPFAMWPLYCPWIDRLRPKSDHGLMNFLIFAPPVSAMVAFLIGTVLIALTSTRFYRGKLANLIPITEMSREWWARANGMLLHVSLLWLALTLLAFGAPYVWLRLQDVYLGLGGTTWLTSVVVGVWSAASARTDDDRPQPRVAEWLARAAPYVFIVGLLGMLATGLHYAGWAMHQHGNKNDFSSRAWSQAYCPKPSLSPGRKPAYRVTATENELAVDSVESVNHCGYEAYARESQNSIGCIVLASFVALLVWLFLGIVVDINVFSFHYFYRNRLERCYLGASAGTRKPSAYTGLDEKDSPRLDELATYHPDNEPPPSNGGNDQQQLQFGDAWSRLKAFGSRLRSRYEKLLEKNSENTRLPVVERVIRPYPLINTTLNITHDPVDGATDRLGWQERKAASFVMSPLYCGYRLAFGERGIDAFQRTAVFGTESSAGAKLPLTLGMGMTISGAAASPNSGYHTNPATAFLMTVFNTRLGWWLRNPRKQEGWKKGNAPNMGAWLLLNELMGTTSDQTEYIYLSDGGHFENLGIYELIRRRCKVIVASDAGQDAKFTFEDLGNAIRKCRTDFGVDIDIDPRPITPNAQGISERHCAAGIIRYPETEELPAAQGWLLYIKASLTGDESADVLQYKRQHDEFPHQSTADQWFDESQFESYRKLGQQVGEHALLGERAALAAKFQRSFANCADRAEGAQAMVEWLRSLDDYWRRNRNSRT